MHLCRFLTKMERLVRLCISGYSSLFRKRTPQAEIREELPDELVGFMLSDGRVLGQSNDGVPLSEALGQGLAL